ncbi:50S ribosomal protein L9 [marine bacterium AO1-C]|nr:50S ribosomal protein L9 [marine bacterium AO1-C]
MEVILKDDIQGLGYKNDIVTVKPGYGRNYLIPQGLAIQATKSAKKVLAENLKQAAHKAEKVKSDAMALAERIGDLVLEIPAKASETGKIFGSVTSTQLAAALAKVDEEYANIDRRKISFDSKSVKTLGEYQATIDLHREVKHTITFKVVVSE